MSPVIGRISSREWRQHAGQAGEKGREHHPGGEGSGSWLPRAQIHPSFPTVWVYELMKSAFFAQANWNCICIKYIQRVLIIGKSQHFAGAKGPEVLETYHIFFNLLEECNMAIGLYACLTFCGCLNKNRMTPWKQFLPSCVRSRSSVCHSFIGPTPQSENPSSTLEGICNCHKMQIQAISFHFLIISFILALCILHISHKIGHQFKEGKNCKVFKTRWFDKSKVFICMFAVHEMSIYVVLFLSYLYSNFLI